jgi:hypothetical protein
MRRLLNTVYSNVNGLRMCVESHFSQNPLFSGSPTNLSLWFKNLIGSQQPNIKNLTLVVDLSLVVVGHLLWNIWKGRNENQYEGKTPNRELTVHKAIQGVQFIQFTMNENFHTTKRTNLHPRWRAPKKQG